MNASGTALDGAVLHRPTGYKMINAITIQNFRCYKHLKIDQCSRLNVIVGDNGSGKTSLLEAIFMALATGPEIAVRYNKQRGLDGILGGTPRSIERALFGEFFYNGDITKPIQITLDGMGDEARSLVISTGGDQGMLALIDPTSNELSVSGSFAFSWKNAQGSDYRVTPQVTPNGIRMGDTGEDLPSFLYFSANLPVNASEAAGRFSDLSKVNQSAQFIEVFKQAYPWIIDISIELSGGTAALFASVAGKSRKLPLANVSAAINRIAAILLAIATSPKSVVLVDEIENGIFHAHQAEIWRALRKFAKHYDSQLFVSTHSKECLNALTIAADDNLEDISLWQIERCEMSPKVHVFDGETLAAGLQYGTEIRGSE